MLANIRDQGQHRSWLKGQALRKVAGGQVAAAQVARGRHLATAAYLGIAAARMKRAAWRGIHGIRGLAFEEDARRSIVGIRHRDGREQGFRIIGDVVDEVELWW